MKPKCSDIDFISLFKQHGPHKLAKKLDCDVRSVYYRRTSLERRIGQKIIGPDNKSQRDPSHDHPARHSITVKNGVVIVASDAHYWPGEPSTAHRALVKLCKELKPKAVIMNGDVMDFPQISRHSPIGWENQPTVVDEIENAQQRLHEIELASGRGVEKIWTLGNHDARFETRLATVAKEYALLNGVHLKDHFPQWIPCWSVWINDSVVVKHRYKGGVHAPHNNTVASGKSIITGHLHSLKVTPYNDYNGTRYGVDCGCIADTNHKAFVDYTEDGPLNWRSGFIVLTFEDGYLMWPEVVSVVDTKRVQFRGRMIQV